MAMPRKRVRLESKDSDMESQSENSQSMSQAESRAGAHDDSGLGSGYRIEFPPSVNGTEKKYSKKRRRTDSEDSPAPPHRWSLQPSPFVPTGKFYRANHSMDRQYRVETVEPAEDWSTMTRYNSFVRRCRL